MKLSAAIMAHPSRRDHVDFMVNALDIDGRKFTVTWDEYGDGLWANARQAWSSYDPDADYHVVLQDDILPCRDLLAGTEKALEMLAYDPGSCMSLFCGHRVIEYAMNAGKTWIWETAAVHGPAMVMPTGAIDDFLEWCDLNVDPMMREDDYRVSMYMLATKRKMYYTAPSLIEHLGWGRSLVNKPGKNQVFGVRRAAVFIGEDSSALEIKWGPVSRARRGSFGDTHMYHHWYIGVDDWFDDILELKNG